MEVVESKLNNFYSLIKFNLKKYIKNMQTNIKQNVPCIILIMKSKDHPYDCI